MEKLIFYIALAIVYTIITGYAKRKKELEKKEQQKKINVDPEKPETSTRPVISSTPKETPPPLSDIFGELFKTPKTKTSTPAEPKKDIFGELLNNPKPKTPVQAKKKEKVYKKPVFTETKATEQSSMTSRITGNDQSLEQRNIERNNDSAYNLQDSETENAGASFDIRQALIAQVILERPKF